MDKSAEPGQRLSERKRQLSVVSEITTYTSLRSDDRDFATLSPVSPIRVGSNSSDGGNHQEEDIYSQTQFRNDAPGSKNAIWLPYTLRGCVIWIPTALSLSLGLVTLLLHWRSSKNDGLSTVASAMFGWRFVPTLIAVLYTHLTTMLFDDVKRTEPFARLARLGPVPPHVSRTLMETDRNWFKTLAHGFKKKENGGKRSWVLICACLINMLASLGISPLSSALLDSEEVHIRKTMPMSRLAPKDGSRIQPIAERDTYFRTIGAVLQDVETSPWISGQYCVLPFWAPASTGSPWGRHLDPLSQTRQGETTVFHSDFRCSRLQLARAETWLIDLATGSDPAAKNHFVLESADGCQYNITSKNWTKLGMRANLDTDSFWANIDKSAYEAYNMDTSHISYNDKCHGEEVIITSKLGLNQSKNQSSFPTDKIFPNQTTAGYICRSDYTMATIPVVVSISQTDFKIEIDTGLFREHQRRVPETLMNSSQFSQLLAAPKVYSYVPSPSAISDQGIRAPGSETTFSGALALLATKYNFNDTIMFDDASLPEKAASIRRRQFGEVLRTSLEAQNSSKVEAVSAEVTSFERRILVRLEAAMVLSALLFSSFLMLLVVLWSSRLSRRPLNMTHDPATVLGTTSLVSSSVEVLSLFRQLDQANESELKRELDERGFSTSPGRLYEVANDRTPHVTDVGLKCITTLPKRIRSILKLRFLVSLMAYFIALIVAVTVVYEQATKSNLHRGFFTYKMDLKTFGYLGSFTPFSMIPTSLAIILSLWWDSLDRAFRHVQPYASMSKSPVQPSRGWGATYQSSYWLWAAGKAVKNKHYMLTFVALGSFLSQAFVIAMSALFEQHTGVVTKSIEVGRTLELRQVPHVFTDRLSIGAVLSELLLNMNSSWLHSGVIQETLSGPQPPWTMDGWGFVPVDMSGTDKFAELDPEITLESSDSRRPQYSSMNITVETSAIRGRVECSPIEQLGRSDSWLELYDYPNPETNSTSKVYVPTGMMFNETTYVTPVVPDFLKLECCSNQTDPSRTRKNNMPVAIGYWTHNYDFTTRLITKGSLNFTAKWIHGQAGSAVLDGSSDRIFFPDPPQAQALNCMPIVESARAEVVIKNTGDVQAYRILEQASPEDGAWSEEFVRRNPSYGQPDYDPIPRVLLDPTESVLDYTVSYGFLFLDTLLRASRLEALEEDIGSPNYEGFSDSAFNIRDNQTGLNIDFMSYASYKRAGEDASALLDYDTLLKHTQHTFSAFFQHFAIGNNSRDEGSWAYQPIGAQLQNVGPPVPGTPPQFAPNGQPAVNVTDLPPRNTQPTAKATVSSRVEVLRINEVAFWVALGLLIWLVMTILAIAALQRKYFGNLYRNIESIADVLTLVAGSERLLALVRERGVDELMKDDSIKTSLGWFSCEDGRMRWGIEVVNDGDTKGG